MSLYRTCSFCLPVASLALVYHPFPTFRLPAWNLNPRVCNCRFDISCVFCFPVFLWFLNSASSYDHSQLFPHNGEARLLNSPSTLSAAKDSCVMSDGTDFVGLCTKWKHRIPCSKVLSISRWWQQSMKQRTGSFWRWDVRQQSRGNSELRDHS